MSDALTPLRRAYGVEAPGTIRATPGDAEPAVEAALLAQGRTALDAAVAAQDRRPSASVLAAVLAEAARASAEVLGPLAAVRALYGESVTADVPASEAALLAQTRAAVEQTVDARPQSPSAATVAAVVAYAAAATRLAPRPDAPVEAPALQALAVAYGLPTTASAVAAPVETRLLVQTRALLDAAPPAAACEASVAAVVARAAAASRLAPRPDASVESPALAALAVAYGLPLAASAGAPHATETQLLVQTRGLLDAAPAAGGPSAAVLAAVTARAAQASTRPATDRPLAAPPAADREPVRAARPRRRIGAWSSAAVAALALVVFFLPRPAGAPEVPATADALAGAEQVASEPAQDVSTPSLPAPGVPAPSVPAPDAGVLVASAAPASPSALASPGASIPSQTFAVAAERAPASAPTARATGPAPAVQASPAPQPTLVSARSAAPREEVRSVAAPGPTTVLASAVTSGDTPPATDEAWEAQRDLRVLSLRLQELRRGHEGLAWDTPTEAFGAPTTRSAFTTPGVQSVRQTVPAARARLFTVPGDR